MAEIKDILTRLKNYIDQEDNNEQVRAEKAEETLGSRIDREISDRTAADVAEFNRATSKENEIIATVTALDLQAQGIAGQYIRTVSQTAGQVTATPVNFDSDFDNPSNNNAPTTKAVNDRFALIDEAGTTFTLTMNQSDYRLTLTLKNRNGYDLKTETIDLPLESVVVGGRYDESTKSVILTLQDSSNISFSVADLVAGLQSEINENNKLNSDLVDDTNSTHKFVTASEKTQITTNQNVIAAIKDGNTLDSFRDVEDELNKKVDKISGKGLSTVDFTDINYVHTDNNYTTAEKNKLAGIEAGTQVFTIEKGSIGNKIGVSDFFNYLITTGFNPSQYLNKICRFSYVDSWDYKYEYLVIPTYYDASSNYSNLTIISDGGVYIAYISANAHEITPYIDEDWLYSYCGNLNNLQTKNRNTLVSAINEVNTIAKESASTISDLKTALYGYVLDTTGVDIDRNIPSTVDIGGVTYDLADKVRASFNILGGRSVFVPENSLNIPDVEETTVKGVTYSIKDGIIRINGTATGNGEIQTVTLNHHGTFYFQPFMSGTITPNSSGATGGIKIIPMSGDSAPDYNQAGVCINAETFSVTFVQGATYNNVMFRPALVYGTNQPSIRFDDPASIYVYDRNNKLIKTMLRYELTALRNYLLANYSQYGQHLMVYSINDSVYNYIDFAKKKFIINCGERSYQAGDEADPNVFTDLTKSVYKLETPIEVDISSIITDDSGITPPIELGGRIIAWTNNTRSVTCKNNIEMVYKKIKESM